jgi:hypothetical protein
VVGYIDSAETANDDFNLSLSWSSYYTTMPVTTVTNDIFVVTNISDAYKEQYSMFKVEFQIEWDLPAHDVTSSDYLACQLRRMPVGVR